MELQSLLEKIAVWAIPVLFAITVHEVAHGWVASKFGDKTALLQGRITLNPIKHIDLFGTIIVPIILLSVSNFIFGWAKPVPVDPRNLRHPRRDMALVAAAGPISNLIMALLWAGVMKLGLYLIAHKISDNTLLVLMGEAGVIINIVLAVLNFIPIPPLDGSRVVSSLLPPRAAFIYNKTEQLGFLLLITLMLTGILWQIMGPPIQFLYIHILKLYGLIPPNIIQ